MKIWFAVQVRNLLTLYQNSLEYKIRHREELFLYIYILFQLVNKVDRFLLLYCSLCIDFIKCLCLLLFCNNLVLYSCS